MQYTVMELKNEIAKFKSFPNKLNLLCMNWNKTEYITTANIAASTSQKYMAYPDENFTEK